MDNLLEKTNLPKDFEILSIDIDSYDLEVWESLVFYKPKIVIIEINSSYPPGIINGILVLIKIPMGIAFHDSM